MRFSRRPLRASVVHVVAAFAPLVGCSDALDVDNWMTTTNPPPIPSCEVSKVPGCVPGVASHDAALDAGAGDASTNDATRPDSTVPDALTPMDAVVAEPYCPASAPLQGSACATAETCYYGPNCDTRPTRTARCSNARWDIIESTCNPPPIACPDAAPAEDATCSPGFGVSRCNYGSCDGGAELTYECSASCNALTQECSASTWKVAARCGTQVCPRDKPLKDTACFHPPGATCGYDLCSGAPSSIATCTSNGWSISQVSCNPPPLCPALTPAEGSACSIPAGVVCTFSLSVGGTVMGRCLGERWSLGPPDAGP